MAVVFNPPNQPGGNPLNPVVIWVQNLISALLATFGLIRSVVPPVVFETGAVATGTNGNMPGTADTVPTNTMGDQYMSLTITPTNANSTLIIDVFIGMVVTSVASNNTLALFQDSTVNALASQFMSSGAQPPSFGGLRHKMTAGTTSATTFKVRIGMDRAGTLTFNGNAGTRVYGGTLASSITITEILP